MLALKIVIGVLMTLVLAFLVVFYVFRVEDVEVKGNVLYDKPTIESVVLNDEYSWNSLYVFLKYKLVDTKDVPFIDTMEVSLKSPTTLQIQVYEKGMVGYLYLFIAALMRETSAGKPHTASSSSQYVLNAIKYIQFNYSHDISIDDVAKSVGVSRSHLYRVFMLNVGKSPIDYLTEYRINEACKLLRAGSLSIAEVAVSVGFFDQFYFSRVFKRAKGVPPSKYFAAQQDADPASPAHL